MEQYKIVVLQYSHNYLTLKEILFIPLSRKDLNRRAVQTANTAAPLSFCLQNNSGPSIYSDLRWRY